MKTLLILLLFTFSCYGWPGNGNGNGHNDGDDHPGHSDPPNDNCAHCEPETPIDIDFADFALGCGFAVLVLRMYKPFKN